MTNPRIWSLASAVSGAIVAAVMLLAFDTSVWSAMLFLGLWIIAGAAVRILVEYARVKRTASELKDE